MARRDPSGVGDSISGLHAAESASCTAVEESLKAQGRRVIEEREHLQRALDEQGFNPTHYLSEQQQGRIDLAIAACLAVLNVALSTLVFMAFGPVWLAPVLAILVLLTAGAVEEFFTAYDRRSVFGEAFFLTLCVISLTAQFWLGSIRGLLAGALVPADVGPVTRAFTLAAPILQWGLAVLAVVAEVLCGYKFYRARKQLYSPVARGVRAREACDRKLVEVHGAIKALEVEPEVRRHCREVGAREYLSSASRAEGQKEHGHLLRAAVGAGIALLVLAFLFLGASSAFGAELESKQPLVVLLDLTKSTSSEGFRANCDAVAEILAQAEEGERVLVVGITDSFGNVPILVDRTMPGRGYLGLQLQAARETLRAEWFSIAANLEPTYMRTDLIGSLQLIAGFMGLAERPLRLVVFSDLRQASRDINLEVVSIVPVKKSLGILARKGQIPAFSESDVFLLGVDSSNKSAAYMATLKEFWIEFFAAAGARVRVFSVMRDVSVLGK